jgi:DNA (cytosine-5)-methyltransferase 1
MRARLTSAPVPWVIENVPGAPLRRPFQLCGSSFGLRVRRHRWFETPLALLAPPCDHHWQDVDPIYEIRQHGRSMRTGVCYVFGGGQAGQPVASWREAMELPGLTVDELSQAIPPAYTEWIGTQLLAVLERAA